MAGDIIGVPVRNDLPNYKFTLELELSVYEFTFTFNDRMQKWIMDIATEALEPIVQGIPVMVNWQVLKRFKDERLPPGRLMFIDTSGKAIDPLRDDLGARVLCLYEESA